MANQSWDLESAEDYSKTQSEQTIGRVDDDSQYIQKGSKVKLVFTSKTNNDQQLLQEPLWVEILLVQDGKLLGQLEDDPQEITQLARGELVEFEEKHILESEYVDIFSPTIKL